MELFMQKALFAIRYLQLRQYAGTGKGLLREWFICICLEDEIWVQEERKRDREPVSPALGL